MKREVGPYRIANGQSLGPAVDLSARRLAAIQMPAAWDAANLTYQGSHDGVTFVNVVWTFVTLEIELVTTAAASRYIIFESALTDLFNTFRFIKIRSGTAAAPVAQTADRDLQLVTVPLGW